MVSRDDSGGRSPARATGTGSSGGDRRLRRYLADRQVVVGAGAAAITLVLGAYDTLPPPVVGGLLGLQAAALLTGFSPGSTTTSRRLWAWLSTVVIAATAGLVGPSSGAHLLLVSNAVVCDLDQRDQPGGWRHAVVATSALAFLGLSGAMALEQWQGFASENAQQALGWAVIPAMLLDLFVALSTYRPTLRVVVGEAGDKATAAAERAAADVLIAELCHEVRTPMVAIHHAHEVLVRATLDDSSREALRRASQSASHVVGVLDDALDLVRLDRNALELASEPFDLRRLVEDVGATVRADVGGRPVRVTIQVTPGLAAVRVGDRRRLHQVLLHLLSHALKLTERGEVVLKVAERTPGQVEFVVRDEGRVAGRDAYAGRTADNRFGAGLGIAIARRVLDVLGGEVDVRPTDAGGAEVRFVVPLPAGEAANPSLVEEPAEVGSLRVLVAEDAVVNQWVLRRMLEDLGHEVNVVGNGRAAVESWREARPDVILMDLQMPVMDGFTATRRIREEEGPGAMGVPIVALTAHVQEAEVVRCLEAGMSAHLAKPVRQQELQAALVKAYVRAARARGHVAV
jgi:CheY-like chemotaxis protein